MMAAKRTRRRPEPPTPPKIYVAGLADHNAGHLHGVWLDATVGADTLAASIATMLAASQCGGAEEWAILDTDGFHDIAIDRHDDLGHVSEVAAGIARFGPAFAAWYRRFDTEPPDLAGQFVTAFRGEHWGAEGHVWELFNDEIDDVYRATRWSPMSPYVKVDVTRLTADLVARGEIIVVDASESGQGWVFAGVGVPAAAGDGWGDWYRG
jgi:antirestriction protein